jgi:hypothetical protein
MTAQIRAQKILVFAAGLGADFKQIPFPYKVVAKIGNEIQFGSHRVAGGRVRLTQSKLGVRPIRCSASAFQQARRSSQPNFPYYF